MAIAVNTEAGDLFQKSNLPGIYRTQSSYQLLKQLEDGEELTMEHVKINPTKLSIIPDKHAGLGCKYYMQITSPIRRFSDLLIQIQFLFFFNFSK